MSSVAACLLALLTVGCLASELHAVLSLKDVLSLDEKRAEAERAASVSDKIKELTKALETCANKHDIDCFVGYFDDQCRVMRNSHKTEIGKTAVRQHMQWINQNVPVTFTADEILPSDGNYVVELVSSKDVLADGTVAFDGKGVLVWKKQPDGDYKVYIEMSNSNRG